MAKGLKRSLGRGNPLDSPVRKLRLTFKDVAVSVAGTTGVGFGAAVIGELPKGNILILGAVGYVQLSKNGDADLQDAFDGDYAIGTVATADVDVSDTGEANIVASTALGAATAGLSPIVRGVGETQSIVDNTDNSLEINLNVLIDDANISGTASMLATGRLDLAYIVLGDD
jgi:hypothetical protein